MVSPTQLCCRYHWYSNMTYYLGVQSCGVLVCWLLVQGLLGVRNPSIRAAVTIGVLSKGVPQGAPAPWRGVARLPKPRRIRVRGVSSRRTGEGKGCSLGVLRSCRVCLVGSSQQAPGRRGVISPMIGRSGVVRTVNEAGELPGRSSGALHWNGW